MLRPHSLLSSVVLYCVILCFCFFFFFKQKTAYEMRISDWSSDVCSSDLIGQLDARAAGAALVAASQARRPRRQFFDDRLRDRRRADRPRRTAATRRIWRLPALSPRQPVARVFGRPDDAFRD